MTATARSRLIEIVKSRSFSTGGETKLVSGRSTNFYFNMKPSMLHPESAHLIATLILEALQGAAVDYIGGLEMGAVPLATGVCVLSHGQGRPIGAFFVRKQAKEHGARKLVEGLAPGETLQRQAGGDPGGRDDHGRLVHEGHRGRPGGRRDHRARDHRRRPAGGRRRHLQGRRRPLPGPADHGGFSLTQLHSAAS